MGQCEDAMLSEILLSEFSSWRQRVLRLLALWLRMTCVFSSLSRGGSGEEGNVLHGRRGS
jgi:hypothetical protein